MSKINLGNGLIDAVDGGYIDFDVEDVRNPDGTRITNALAEQWAEEVQRTGGRPHLDPDKNPSVRVAFRITTDMSERLDKVAHSSGRRRLDVLRAAVEEYLSA